MCVNDIEKVQNLPNILPNEFKNVNILINNAGLALGINSVENNNINDAKIVLDTNVLSIINLCSVFLPIMLKNNDGHIINIGSSAGHHAYQLGSIYNASKYAIHGFTSASRADMGPTPIRITHISPGMVGHTEFSNVRLKNDEKAKNVYDNIICLTPEDVADNILYCATRPKHVQIADIITYCTNQSGFNIYILLLLF